MSRLFFTLATAGRLPAERLAELLQQLELRREYIPHYLRALLHEDGATIGEVDFVLGMAALDNNTNHAGLWNLERSRFIFRTYDTNSSGLLEFDEFCDMVRHMLRNRGLDSSPEAVLSEASRFNPAKRAIPMDEFLKARSANRKKREKKRNKRKKGKKKEKGKITSPRD